MHDGVDDDVAAAPAEVCGLDKCPSAVSVKYRVWFYVRNRVA